MEYLANVLPVDPKFWTLNKATMTKNLIKLESNGTASTTLTHDQVQFTPKAFKVTVKFTGDFDEFSPAAFAKLLIKDKDKKYQVFTAPFQVTSKAPTYYFMQAELITNVADFDTLIFQFNTEEHVEILEWKLYPSSDVDSSILNTVESMLPQFLSTFNEKAITIGTNETEIVNLPFAMGESGNLSCHLLFSYVVEASCKMIVTIRVDGSAEPYTPIVMQVQEGPGFVGIPHSFLQVQAAAHLISVTVKLEAYENQSGHLKASIQPKAVRYTCEGRGILNGQGGEYPHAEVSETYDEYPALRLGTIQCSTTCEATTSEYTNIDSLERYTYPSVNPEEFNYIADIPIADVKAFGAAEYWVYDSSKAEAIHITGNLSLTSDGLTFENSVGEGIATYDVLYPTKSYEPLINCIKVNTTGTPNIKVAFSTDGSSWFTVDVDKEWQSIELTLSAMSQKGINLDQLATLNSGIFKKLFEHGSANKLTIAVYMVSSIQQTSFTLNSIAVYYSTDDSNLPLNAPLLTFAIAEDSRARVHWQPSTGQPRAVKVYYGTSVDFGQSVQSAVGATFCEIPGLNNRTKYYFAAATFGYGRESEKSNILSAVPTTSVPRFLLCEADINKITLQWQIVGAVYDSYNIYLGTSEDNLQLHSNTTEMQAVIDNLQNNVEYFVAVTGVKPTEESWYSEIRSARPLLPVLIISDINTGQNEVRLRLRLPDKYVEYTGYTKYRVYYGTTTDAMLDYVEVTSTNVLVSNLATDTQYYFYATGLTDTEESTPSEVASAATDSSLKFTTLGHTGKEKPTQEDADALYTQTVEVTSGIQKYIVPETGTYLIVAIGAAGGKGGGATTNANCLGGFGAVIGGEFDLVANDELYLLVGQKGTDNPQTSGDATTGAGGGMSVVAIKDDTQTDMLFKTVPDAWKSFTKYYLYYYRAEGNPYFCIMFDELVVNADKSVGLKYNGSFTCPYNIFTDPAQEYSSSSSFDCTKVNTASPRVMIRTNCQELIDAWVAIDVTFTEGFVKAPTFGIPVRPLVVAGAGNGGGDAGYSGTPGDNALLDEGTSDAFLSNDYSGGGYRQYRNNSYCGKSFLVGGDAASYYYTRNSNGSYAGFGGGGANKDDYDGGGGGGYRGGVPGSHGGSSYNAGENKTAELNTERTNGMIIIKKIGGNE